MLSAGGRKDPTLGNFIGLNPFHDSSDLRLVKAVQEATVGFSSRFDYEAELCAEEERMRAEDATYRAGEQAVTE